MTDSPETGDLSAHKPVLKRVYSMALEPGLRNFTVKDIQDCKGQRQLTQTLVFDAEEAIAAAAAGIDLLSVRYDPQAPQAAKSLRRAAPHTFMMFVLPFTRVTSEPEALRLAFDAMEAGADSVVCIWDLKFVSALARSAIPVQGHVGLVPRKSTWTGGVRAVGKTLAEATSVYRDVKDLENAGAWAVECEVIPSRIMAELSQRTSLTTIGIGAGPQCDVQFLFAQDILGDNESPFPRHSKQYCDLFAMRQKMQEMRIRGFRDYIADVHAGGFPAAGNEIGVDDAVVAEFIAAMAE